MLVRYWMMLVSLRCCSPIWSVFFSILSSTIKKKFKMLNYVQRGATKLIKQMEGMCYEEKLRALGL